MNDCKLLDRQRDRHMRIPGSILFLPKQDKDIFAASFLSMYRRRSLSVSSSRINLNLKLRFNLVRIKSVKNRLYLFLKEIGCLLFGSACVLLGL